MNLAQLASLGDSYSSCIKNCPSQSSPLLETAATTLATKGPGAVDGQTHLTLLRHLCDDVLHTTHARKVMEKNTEARDKIGKEFREREKRLREIEKCARPTLGAVGACFFWPL